MYGHGRLPTLTDAYRRLPTLIPGARLLLLPRVTVSIRTPVWLGLNSRCLRSLYSMYGFCTSFDDISRLLTLCHGMSRCLTLSTVYVHHLAVSVHNFAVSATQMCQFPSCVWKGRGSEYFSFFPVPPSSICSVALLLHHHCRRPLWVVLYRLFLQHGCGTITRTSNAVGGLAAACSWQSIDELLL